MYLKQFVIFFSVVVVFLCCWEAVSLSSQTLQFILPPPSGILKTLYTYKERFFLHTTVTLGEMFGGFVLALVMAFPFAWAMASKQFLRSILQPTFIIVQCIPMFTLAPLMVLWFGWSYIAIIVPTALMIFFPLTITIYQGLCATPQHLIEFFQLNKATSWQLLTKLQLPWALPYIFAGFRIAVAAAGIGAVAGEWAGGQKGLGLLMLESRRAADLEMMFGALVCLATVSLVLYSIASFMETIVCKKLRCHLSSTKIGAIILFIMFTLSSCSQQQSKNNEMTKTVMLLDWLPNPDHVPLYVGIEQGIFLKHGIELSILKVADPSDTISFLTSNQVNLSLSYMPHTVRAQMHGANIVPIGILIDVPLNAIIYRTDSDIKTIDDLNGKVIGYTIDGTSTDELQKIFADKKIAPKEWRNVSFDSIGTMATHQVDALYGSYWNIEGEHLRFFGVDTSHFPLSSFGVPMYYELIVLAKKESKEDSQSFIAAFDSALQESIDFCRQYPEESFSIYVQGNPDKSQRTLRWEHEAWLKTIPMLAKNQKIDPQLWENFRKWLQ